MRTNAFTWIGFAIVALGWFLLVAAMAVSDSQLRAGNLVAVLSLRGDIVTIAQTAIISGFGCVLYGGLRSGFGALNRFFEAVLQRSSAPRATAVAPPAPAPDPEPMREPIIVETTAVESRPAPTPQPGRKRNYVILSDGSVEVETLFGTRIFATMDEARDFIR